MSHVFDDMSEETRLQFSPQIDERADFLIVIHSEQSENNIAQRTAPEGVVRSESRRRQQADTAASVRSGPNCVNCAAAPQEPENRLYLQNALPIAAVTRAQSSSSAKPETVPQPSGMSVQGAAQGKPSAQTASDDNQSVEVEDDSMIVHGPSNDVTNVAEGDDLVELPPISAQDYIGD